MTLKNLRRFSQTLFLLLFLWLFLQTESRGDNELGYPVKIFLDADPLLWITTVLASRSFYGAFALAGAVIVVTIFLGRVFCGWICPFGTLHQMVGGLRRIKTVTGRRRRNIAVELRERLRRFLGGRPRAGPAVAPGRSPARGEESGDKHPEIRTDRDSGRQDGKNWGPYRSKYLLLVFILVLSVLRVQAAGIFDPLSLLVRSLSLSVYPLFSYALRAVFDTLYHGHVPILSNGAEIVYDSLRKTVLPFSQPFFFQGAAIGVLFFFLLALNLRERRFWCRHLCPLGALLGLLSRFALLKRSVSEGCNDCGRCRRDCQGGAIGGKGRNWAAAECMYCFDCDDPCPQNAVSFGFSSRPVPHALDLGKRRVLGAALAASLAAPLLRITPLAKAGAAEPELIRPPGALPETLFLKRCLRCGECMKVCITGGLQPTLWEAGPEGIWSPVLVPRIGGCEYRCTLCGQVCPTGAIGKLTAADKAVVKIGSAMIDKGRCLPFAHHTSCIVCEEVCPTSPKAVWFEEVRLRDRRGREVVLKQPHVDLSVCVGCGVCENKCPVLGRPAIVVTSLGESRSPDNRLLLIP
ncbi:MAG TPA: 4Fe-4S binding protein [Syntrophales bacterium]|nr:4Fe-4S binding protein [Syntrophales bacterium]